jgi:hypothetical protein
MLFEGSKSYYGEILAEPLELLTERLRLRTPQVDDADAIQSIAAKWLAEGQNDAIDPKATLAEHCDMALMPISAPIKGPV